MTAFRRRLAGRAAFPYCATKANSIVLEKPLRCVKIFVQYRLIEWMRLAAQCAQFANFEFQHILHPRFVLVLPEFVESRLRFRGLSFILVRRLEFYHQDRLELAQRLVSREILRHRHRRASRLLQTPPLLQGHIDRKFLMIDRPKRGAGHFLRAQFRQKLPQLLRTVGHREETFRQHPGVCLKELSIGRVRRKNFHLQQVRRLLRPACGH